MPFITKESLERLRQKVEIFDVVSAHVDLKKSGATYKGLCPFHEEKTPSLIVKEGDRSYHCFGCGAHGDAIEFLMSYQKLGFADAISYLAERFQVPIDYVEDSKDDKIDIRKIKTALITAHKFYHFYLLETEEGREALSYLKGRGIDLSFVRRFQLGLSPRKEGIFTALMREHKQSYEFLALAGLLRQSGSRHREVFLERIMFPIFDRFSSPIGFSARKFYEHTYGGKYINTEETPLFKKSRVLFALNFAKRAIVKERHAFIVEGQIDALRMIEQGFENTVSAQGTAFGAGHVLELKNLGIIKATLCFDGDEAGKNAAYKVGDLFQKEGIEAKVALLPDGLDPDTFLREKGKLKLKTLLENSTSYIGFCVDMLAKENDLKVGAHKQRVLSKISSQIHSWGSSVMSHEGLFELSQKLQLPKQLIEESLRAAPNVFIKKHGFLEKDPVDHDLVLEGDFLRCLLLSKEKQLEHLRLCSLNLSEGDLIHPATKKIYKTILEGKGAFTSSNLLSLMIALDDLESQQFLEALLKKKMKKPDEKESLFLTIKRILDRNWMKKREEIRMKMQSGNLSDEEILEAAKEFDRLKKEAPVLKEE